MSKLVDKRDLPIFIHSSIDDMTGLTPNAMRAYMHLARRADKDGVAWPSYQSVGDHCFGCISDNAATRKSFARKAIDDLLKAGLILKTPRVDENGEHSSNAYQLVNPPMPIDTPMPIKHTPVPIKHTPMPIGTPVLNKHERYSNEDTPIEGTPIEDTPRKKGRRAAPDRTPPHPAVLAYREVFKCNLSKAQAAVVAEAGVDIADWVRAMRAWLGRGYSPRNIAGMLDWARNPKLAERTNGHGPAQSKVAGSNAAMDQYEEIKQRHGVAS